MQFFRHRDGLARAGARAPAADRDIEAAYEHGRRDARPRRRHPFVTLGVTMIALAGAGLIGLAAVEGSFSRSGRVVDQTLSVAADQVQVASRDAAVATTEAVRDASTTLRRRTDGRADSST